MAKTGIVVLIPLVMCCLIACNVSGAVTYGNISGFKSYDYNQNGQLDGNGFLLPGWNITLYYPNGSMLASTLTNAYGYYYFDTIDRALKNYTLTEEIQTGWHNTSLAIYDVSFEPIPETIFYNQNEFTATEEDLASYMWNMPYASSRVLLAFNHRIGDGSGTKESEIKIFEPLGNWNPGASSSDLSPTGQVSWQNNVYLPFNDTWVPVTLKQRANVTVGGSSVNQNADPSAARSNSIPIRDIVIRLHSENANYKVDVSNLLLRSGATTVSLTPNTFSWNGSTASGGQDFYRVVRAGPLLGGDISTGGFSLTGDIRFTWTGRTPTMNELKMDVYVGRFRYLSNDTIVRNFANHINGTISGYKLDTAGVGLPNWNITCTNQTLSVFQYDLTGSDGYYEILNIPPGYFLLNESSDSPDWVPVTGFGNRTVFTDLNNLNLINQNFTNYLKGGFISGYKLDQEGQGLVGWTITANNESIPFFGSSVTDDTGFYNITDVPTGTFWLNETLMNGWNQLTPNRLVETNTSFPRLLNQNFTNQQLFGSISGQKTNTESTGLDGWQINLYYENGTLFGSQTTDASGNYLFNPVPFGNYTVTETHQYGWEQTDPSSGYFDVNMTHDELDFEGLDFVNEWLSGSISGQKTNTESTGLDGWQINLYYENGTLFGSQTTDASGNYLFNPVPFGNYTVTETHQYGWEQTDPSSGYFDVNMTHDELDFEGLDFVNEWDLCVGGYKLDTDGNPLPGWTITVNDGKGDVGSNITDDNGYWQVCGLSPRTYNVSETMQDGWTALDPATGYQDVTLTDASNFTVNFTNQHETPPPITGSVSGMKFGDLNANGIRDLNDNPLQGWIIRLFYQGNNTLFESTTTNATGEYSFINVPLGSFILNEVQQTGWTQTAPAGGSYLIEVNATSWLFTGRNFGNVQATNCCSCPTRAYFTNGLLPTPPRTVQFTDGSTGNPYYWLWSFGDGKYTLGRSPTHTYTRAGSYTVKLTVKGKDCSGNVHVTYYTKVVQVP